VALSTPFTTLTSSTDLALLSWANEIVLAYSERRQAIKFSAVDPLAATEVATSRVLWREMQDWVEVQCGNFVRTSTPEVVMYTVATLREDAGLNANGFTRHTDTGIQYGLMAGGDHRAIINFQELQRVFGVMTKTKIEAVFESRSGACGLGTGGAAEAKVIAQERYDNGEEDLANLAGGFTYAVDNGFPSFTLSAAKSSTEATLKAEAPTVPSVSYTAVIWAAVRYGDGGAQQTEWRSIGSDGDTYGESVAPEDFPDYGGDKQIMLDGEYIQKSTTSFSTMYAVVSWDFTNA